MLNLEGTISREIIHAEMPCCHVGPEDEKPSKRHGAKGTKAAEGA